MLHVLCTIYPIKTRRALRYKKHVRFVRLVAENTANRGNASAFFLHQHQACFGPESAGSVQVSQGLAEGGQLSQR